MKYIKEDKKKVKDAIAGAILFAVISAICALIYCLLFCPSKAVIIAPTVAVGLMAINMMLIFLPLIVITIAERVSLKLFDILTRKSSVKDALN